MTEALITDAERDLFLTSYEAVKSYLDASDEDEDEAERTVIERYIADTSRMVRLFTGRRFTTEPVEETRTYSLGSRRSLYVDELLSNADIESVTDSEGSPLDYRYSPDRSSTAKGGRLRFGGVGSEYGWLPPMHADNFIREGGMWGAMTRAVSDPIEITATFGYDGPPPEIEYLTRRAVKIMHSAEDSYFSQYYESASGQVVSPEMLPPAVVQGLRPWVLPGLNR